MKKSIIMFLLCSGMAIAQQGINYKAIISDDGAVIQNQQIAVSFTILEDGITIVYKELHVLNTDANGLIITNIGEGTPTEGDFITINWSNAQFLKVEIDTGNGTIDMGTTAFKNVPYALHAKTATTITGPLPDAGNLEKITEDNKTGYRLADANPNFYGDIGINAVDFSIPEGESSSAGATGNSSFASGLQTTASGYASTAIGSYGTASGDHSASIGFSTDASGAYATAMGLTTTAESWAQFTVGIANTTVASVVPDSFVPTERLFVIGNGATYLNRSDAMVVLKSGDTEINGQLTIDAANDDTGYTLPSSKGDPGQVLTMNETDSGTHWKSAGYLAKIIEGGNTGYRLADVDPNFYGEIGSGAVDLSKQFGVSSTIKGATGLYAFASGQQTTASGITSVALGSNTTASGIASVALGRNTEASGYASLAFGNYTDASGNYSMALGRNTDASGESSIALGSFTIAESYAQTTFGSYNTVASGTVDSFVATDRLFVLGNGQNTSNKSDAMVVLKNGNTTINGDLDVNEVQGEDSGDADMKAYIYGLVTYYGTLDPASSDGFTVTRNGIGSYSVVFNNAPSSIQDYMVVSSLHGSIGFIKTVRNTTHIAVNTYNSSGESRDIYFNFVVYKK